MSSEGRFLGIQSQDGEGREQRGAALPGPHNAYPEAGVGSGRGEGLPWAGCPPSPTSHQRPTFGLMEERLVLVTRIANPNTQRYRTMNKMRGVGWVYKKKAWGDYGRFYHVVHRAASCRHATVGSGVVKSSDFLKEKLGMQPFMRTLLTFTCWQQIQV